MFKILQNLILRWVYSIQNLHQTNNYARAFHFVQNACFWHKNINIKKGHARKRLGTIYSDSACFSHAKTTLQVDNSGFF
jgi:hypothetical protein